MDTRYLSTLSRSKKRAEIAELCGWTVERTVGIVADDGEFINTSGRPAGTTLNDPLEDLPDYLNDLNAIHEVVVHFTRNEGQWFWDVFRTNLERINPSEFWNATAEQRCDAFLRSVI